MKILVSRTDRAGDVILTTPIFSELKKAFPQALLTAHIRKYTEPIIKLCQDVDNIIIDDKYKSIFALAKAIKQEKFTHAILVHPSFKAIMATFLAGVPCRIGRASNIWQFLLTDRQIQKRSKNEKHEFQYNLDLIKPIVKDAKYEIPTLKVNAQCTNYGYNYLEKVGQIGKLPIIIHPGHGGSAHNLSIDKYVELTASLIEKEIPVLLSLGPQELSIESKFDDFSDSCYYGVIKNIPNFEKLAGIFKHCSVFIGGSTGPMHLAAALNLSILAFFPPQKSMTPIRWGPVASSKLILKPSVEECVGKCKECHDLPCMDKIDLQDALDWVLHIRKQL